MSGIKSLPEPITFSTRYQQDPLSLEDVMHSHRKSCERCRYGKHCGEYIRLRDGR